MLSQEAKLELTDPALAEYVSRYVVTAAGCHEWTGHRDKRGYARLSRRGHTYLMHRVAYAQAHGPIPDGLMVRHKVCDNPPCINLEHLRAGTAQDNSDDRAEHGRAYLCGTNPPRGARNGNSKLSATQVDEIRERYSVGKISMRALAKEFGIASSAVSNIVNGKRWGNQC